MGSAWSELFDGGSSSSSSDVCRRLPNISISATSTPEQISSAIQRLEARCVRLSKLKTNAEALKEDDEESDEATVSKRQTLITELVASMKSLEADIVRYSPAQIPERLTCCGGMHDCVFGPDTQVVLKRFQIEAEAAAIIDGKFDAPVGKKKSRSRSESEASPKK